MFEEPNPSVTEQPVAEVLPAVDTVTDEPDYRAQWLRAIADYRNLQREIEAQRATWAELATADLVIQLLPVLNNFAAAVAHVPPDQQQQPWVIGIFHIQRQLAETLKTTGVEAMATVGQPFDPARHEALGQQTSATIPEGIIITEVQPGYTLNGKVIAPAKVIVSSGLPPQPPTGYSADEDLRP